MYLIRFLIEEKSWCHLDCASSGLLNSYYQDLEGPWKATLRAPGTYHIDH